MFYDRWNTEDEERGGCRKELLELVGWAAMFLVAGAVTWLFRKTGWGSEGLANAISVGVGLVVLVGGWWLLRRYGWWE